MEETQRIAIVLIVLCTFFTSLGQLLWKGGLKYIDFSILSTFFNWPFVLGFVSYGLGAVLMILAFRRGELSVLYPIFATSYIWVSLASPLFFPSDSMNAWKWAGVSIILVSVSLLGWGNTRRRVAHHG